ncbi:MAG TPA: hypothetical protein VMV49_18645 [Candidatus Deferrimicrobium sp.]|nr:hypothetical protein [Candidatus Deferrimicrobium sp.]
MGMELIERISWILYGATIFLSLFLSYQFFKKVKTGESNKFWFGLATFSLLFAVSFIIWIIGDTFLAFSESANIIIIAEFNLTYILLWKISLAIIFSALALFMFALESEIIRKTKYLLSIFVGLTPLIVLLGAPHYEIIEVSFLRFIPPISIFSNVYYIISLNIVIWITLFLYGRIAITVPEHRFNSLGVGLGILLLALGKTMSFRITDFIFLNEDLEMLLSGFCLFLGFILIYFGFSHRLRE